mmetsp:Transcript_20311/g.27470  ORF Transcript_20311/g.27470 Transcript_20311/m.27470 type:complete len:122 (+) Transcript_20311:135-500(+)
MNVGSVCTSSQDSIRCVNVESWPLIWQSQFAGVRICGKLSSTPFVNMTRAHSSNDCPEGTSRCIESMAANATVCVADVETDCPITDLKVISNEASSGEFKDYQQAGAFNETTMVVFSKKVP